MRKTRTNNDDANLAESPVGERKPRYKNIVHLWEFLLELLADERCRSLITWSREAHGEFKLKNQEEVAKRWGSLKRRPNMNYEKLSRALRHYYQQGIIKKVPGQRLVYKFHKLPYEYTPGKAPSESNLTTSPRSTIRKDKYCFKEPSSCSSKSPDESGRPLTSKEKMKRLLQERVNVTRRMDKAAHPEQNEEAQEIPTPPASLELSEMLSEPFSQSMIPTPINQPVCCCRCSFQTTQIMFPFPAHEHRSFFPYGLNYHCINLAPPPVPVSVITKRFNRYDQLLNKQYDAHLDLRGVNKYIRTFSSAK